MNEREKLRKIGGTMNEREKLRKIGGTMNEREKLRKIASDVGYMEAGKFGKTPAQGVEARVKRSDSVVDWSGDDYDPTACAKDAIRHIERHPDYRDAVKRAEAALKKIVEEIMKDGRRKFGADWDGEEVEEAIGNTIIENPGAANVMTVILAGW